MARSRIVHSVDTEEIKESAKNEQTQVFAQTLNDLLVEKNIHQDDFAKAIGVATGTISAYRHGTKEPKLSILIEMAKYLEVDCNFLMTGVKAENNVISSKLGLSDGAIEKLKAIYEKREIRAYSDLLSLLICDCDFEWFLGVLEGYFAEEKNVQTDFGVSRIIVNNKNLALLAATDGLRNILERVSSQFKAHFHTTDERLDIFTEKKMAKKEAAKNGKH